MCYPFWVVLCLFEFCLLGLMEFFGEQVIHILLLVQMVLEQNLNLHLILEFMKPLVLIW